MNDLVRFVGQRAHVEEIDLEALRAGDDLARGIGEPAGLRNLARTRMLAAGRSVDHQHARG